MSHVCGCLSLSVVIYKNKSVKKHRESEDTTSCFLQVCVQTSAEVTF